MVKNLYWWISYTHSILFLEVDRERYFGFVSNLWVLVAFIHHGLNQAHSERLIFQMRRRD